MRDCVNEKKLSPGIQLNCKSSNVIYLGQCHYLVCDPVQDNGDINCYAGQTMQPLHKRVKARGGGGVKFDFPVFTYLIRAAGDEQEEKNFNLNCKKLKRPKLRRLATPRS